MHNTNLSIGNTGQAITIEPQGITAQGGPENPTLWIPFTIAFTPPHSGHSKVNTTFIVSNISAQLHLTTSHFRVAQAQIFTNWHVSEHNPYKATFVFCLTAEQLFYIEKHREPDLPASLQITVQVAMQERLPATPKGGYSPTVLRDIECSQAQQYFTIPQYQWVNTLLPKLGYHAGTLIEIPAVSILLPKEYTVARQELQKAHQYFIAGDYDKTVAHCRSAIDPIRPEFPKIKPDIVSNSRFTWLKAQYSAIYEFIDVIINSNYTIANKSHHPPSIGNFGRNEATAILGITTQIIAYFGTIIPDGPLPPPTPLNP